MVEGILWARINRVIQLRAEIKTGAGKGSCYSQTSGKLRASKRICCKCQPPDFRDSRKCQVAPIHRHLHKEDVS